jgi:serine O-acetyltransferase
MRASEKTQRRLEQIADTVADSYRRGRPIDSLESTGLPNRRKIIEAIVELEHVVYMGFYSTRELSPVTLRQYIGEHLYRAAEMLMEQIGRAVGYQRSAGAPNAADQRFSEEVVMETLAQVPRLREELALDVQAAYDGDPAAKSIEEVVFSYPAVRAITIYRFAHELYLRKVPMVPRIMTEYAHGETGIEIHPGARIGKCFFIDHGTGVVIGETAVIGDNVKLFQGVTLGALSFARDHAGAVVRDGRRHPTIEDNVTIYAGATILGGDTVIGRDSVIGSNTWIVRSVAPGTRVTYAASENSGEPSQRFQTPIPPRPER